jgi:dTDP-4-amino-4,6-dideoxygalactose transaminase
MKNQNFINVAKADLPPLKEYNTYLKKIWKSHWLTNNGQLVQDFQEQLQRYLKVDYVIPVANGTLALQIAIKALDLKGEVITTPFTFVATSTALIWENCTPIFADIDPNTYNIDPVEVEKKITKNTTAILAVHVYGNPCEIEKLDKIAKKHDLKIIYDAAHAFGVEYKNQSVLNFGDASILSFHATKTFHTIEGGAIVTRDRKTFEKIKLLINFGIESEEEIVLAGINAKMNEFQAAMGLCNLKAIDDRIKKRKRIYEQYVELLKTNNIKFQTMNFSKFNYTYIPIVLNKKENRDLLYKELINHNIRARKYFYPLITNTRFYKENISNKELKLSNSQYISDRVLCLPIYSTLSSRDVNKIINIVNAVTSRK